MSTERSTTTAYLEGYCAFGERMTDNIYAADSQDYYDWWEGNDDAESAYLDSVECELLNNG